MPMLSTIKHDVNARSYRENGRKKWINSSWNGRKEFPSFGNDFMHEAYFLMSNNRLSRRLQFAREWHIQSEMDFHTFFFLRTCQVRYNIPLKISGSKSDKRITYHSADRIYRCSLEFWFVDCLSICVPVMAVEFWFNSLSQYVFWIYVIFSE